MNSSYQILNFIIELKNDYEVQKVLIETKMEELNREIEELVAKKNKVQKMNLEPSSVFSPYHNHNEELSQINLSIEAKEKEMLHIKKERLKVQNKQVQIQYLQRMLIDMVDQECEQKEENEQIELHKNNQLLTALNFTKQIDHTIAVQLKSISGDLDSLFGVFHNSKQCKKSIILLKRDIKLLEDMADYLYAGVIDTVGIVEAVNQLIQLKTKDRAVHIIFKYDEQVEQADTTKKYFLKQIIYYLYGMFETINSLSKIELYLSYKLEQYHLIVKIDSYSSDTIETYPVINQLIQAYAGTFSVEPNEYFTQFNIKL